MDYNAYFNSNGKIAADSDFFKNFPDVFTGADGIVDGFKTVLGEQIIHARRPWRTPIYSLAIGAPLRYGAAWSERLLRKTNTYEFNRNATAQDDLGFYDSEGYEKVFTINYAGRKTVSAASDLALRELLIPGNGGQINDYLVDGMTKDVQGELEAMAGVNLVSSIQHEVNDADLSTPDKIRKLINDTAIAMKTDGTKYSRMALDTEYADEVVVLMDAAMARDLSNSEAILPDAARLNVEARIIPIYGGLPTPITEQQFNAGRGASGSAYDSGSSPVAMGKAKPNMIIMDSKYFEIRPYIDEWKMTTSYNGAGDFRNYHCLYKGAMGFKPWKNAVRIYAAA